MFTWRGRRWEDCIGTYYIITGKLHGQYYSRSFDERKWKECHIHGYVWRQCILIQGVLLEQERIRLHG